MLVGMESSEVFTSALDNSSASLGVAAPRTPVSRVPNSSCPSSFAQSLSPRHRNDLLQDGSSLGHGPLLTRCCIHRAFHIHSHTRVFIKLNYSDITVTSKYFIFHTVVVF